MTQPAQMASNSSFDDHVEGEIAACLNLEAPKSFFLFAGAGSGKTRSLIAALRHVRKEYGAKLQLRGQRVAVITFTNAACDEITSRIEFDRLFHVSTIHSFAWQLIEGFHSDIREWLRHDLRATVAELQQLEAKGRQGTKASIARLSQIESKTARLERLDTIRKFTYNPTGDNREKNSLNHSEVIALCASFLSGKPLMQRILVKQYPILLIDEGQDTNKYLIDAFMVTEANNRGRLSLGFIGDTMQRIYNDGKENIEAALPPEWEKPIKRLNHRCPKRVVQLINQIRSEADEHQQEPSSESIVGYVRLFLLPAQTPNKAAAEEAARSYMARTTHDPEWTERSHCKILTLEHHMAARRMGFDGIFEPLSEIDEFRTGLLDGSLPAVRLFTQQILPLVSAHHRGDKFAIAKVVREASPLLSAAVLKESPAPKEQLLSAKEGVESLLRLWEKDGNPSCITILENVARSRLFEIPDSLRPILALRKVGEPKNIEGDDAADALPERVKALEAFLSAPFAQVGPYASYVRNEAPYDTHQGVKGREFERVMVLIDDTEARGFMFGYERLLGAKAPSASEVKNVKEGKETTVERTRRLFYVTCSRAKKSLALVAYSEAPNAVREQMIRANWFTSDEIVLELPL
jgi:DNA helicase-2/ATP-dependent DNA helicase PcrA